jgi:fumarate reductase subunit C
MTVRSYVRPMGAWWKRNPFYGWYMVRELSCVFITAYAVVLLVGIWRLTQGREAFEAWRASLLVLYHAWSWFQVMPKTLPFIRIQGRRLSDRAIVTSGVTAAVVASILVFAVVWWLR